MRHVFEIKIDHYVRANKLLYCKNNAPPRWAMLLSKREAMTVPLLVVNHAKAPPNAALFRVNLLLLLRMPERWNNTSLLPPLELD